MQKELNKKAETKETAPKQPEIKIDPGAIKQQYAQMEQQAGQLQMLSEEEMLNKQKEEEQKLDAILPYLRKQAEATRLEMELTRMDVLLGRMAPNQIPGAFGKQLEVECMEAQQKWAVSKMEQQEMMKRAMEEKEKLEKIKKATEETTKEETK